MEKLQAAEERLRSEAARRPQTVKLKPARMTLAHGGLVTQRLVADEHAHFSAEVRSRINELLRVFGLADD